MANGLSLNLQLLQNLSDMSLSNNNGTAQNNKPAVYAKEGEPRYNEDMDLDGDGVVTMEEYQQYCEENNISTDEQIQNVQSMGDSMVQKQASEREQSNISYDDYIQYCEANQNVRSSFSASVEAVSVSATNDSGLVIRNIGRALSSYSGISFPEAIIERNA